MPSEFGPSLREPAIDPEQVAGLTAAEKLKRTEVAQKREAATKAILAHCKDFPDLPLDALDIIGDAQNLEAFTDKIANAGGRCCASGSWRNGGNPASCLGEMTQDGLEMAAAAGGPDFFEADDAEFLQDAQQSRPGPESQRRRRRQTQYRGGNSQVHRRAIGQAMLDPDPGSNAVRKLRDSLQFHPDSLKDPLPVLAARGDVLQDARGP